MELAGEPCFLRQLKEWMIRRDGGSHMGYISRIDRRYRFRGACRAVA